MAVLDSDRIVAALRGAFAREESREALLRITAEKIRAVGPPYTSVYLYMLHGEELVLEAHAGRDTDHTRIPVVVLIRRGNLILGQIDIDSDVPDPFTSEEESAVKRVADALAILL